MDNEEQDAIRALVADWMQANKAADFDKVISMVADDAVFLAAGQPPMNKADFNEALRAPSGPDAPQLHGSYEIKEIQVFGDWAFAWQHLSVLASPLSGGPSKTYTGFTMTIFKKENGKWLFARDANLLTPEDK